jgi:hypothetical protein
MSRCNVGVSRTPPTPYIFLINAFFPHLPVDLARLLIGTKSPDMEGFSPICDGTFSSCSGLVGQGSLKYSARRLRWSNDAAILMEGTFDASNRNRSIVSDSVSSRVFGCSARAVRWTGNGAVEEQQNSGAKSC